MHIYLGLLASVIGLGISSYIYRKKRTKHPLMCPRASACDTVVNSSFATTAGINNEVLGIFYYVAQAILWAVMLAVPSVVSSGFLLFTILLSIGGALFSLYLIALQAFVIRAWCLWCLGSAVANAMFVIALFGLPMTGVFALLASHRLWWIIIHNIGFILGLGGATITDVLFFRFLKDHLISEERKMTMDTLSNVIWVGLGILIVSGIMLYLPEQARLDVSPKFLLKVIVVSVITINGFLLNMFVAPRLRQLSFENTPPARHFRKLAFALGGISLSSWYTAFFLGSLRTIKVPFHTGLMVYIGILAVVSIGSQIFEGVLMRRHTPAVKE
jgi:uncharacterized membrane protein